MPIELDPQTLPFLKPHLIPVDHQMRAFIGQLPDERALLMIRKHWIIELGLFVRLAFWMALPLGTYFAIATWLPDWLSGEWNNVAWILISIWMLFLGLKYYINWLDNFFDIVFLTDRRLIDINQNNLFNRTTTEASLAQLQDVKANVNGVFATLLRYGDILLQTAGENANIELRTVGHPTTVANQILKIRYDYLNSQGEGKGSGEQQMSPDAG